MTLVMLLVCFCTVKISCSTYVWRKLHPGIRTAAPRSYRREYSKFLSSHLLSIIQISFYFDCFPV